MRFGNLSWSKYRYHHTGHSIMGKITSMKDTDTIQNDQVPVLAEYHKEQRNEEFNFRQIIEITVIFFLMLYGSSFNGITNIQC